MKKSKILSSNLFLDLVINPLHIGSPLTSVKLGFLLKKSSNNFQFLFCFLGSPGIKSQPAHRFQSKCITRPDPFFWASITSISRYFQKASFLSKLEVSCGPYATQQRIFMFYRKISTDKASTKSFPSLTQTGFSSFKHSNARPPPFLSCLISS